MATPKQFFAGFCGILLGVQWVQGGLVCSNPVFDYGTVSASVSPSHIFVLENTGSEPVQILKIRKTCGCVAAEASRMQVDPGETAELKMVVSLAGRSGPQSKPVYVQTQNRETPLVRLEMKGTARRTAPQAAAALPARSAAGSKPAVRMSPGLRAIPYEIRLPARAGAQGLFTFVSIQGDDRPGFAVERVLPPAGVPYAVTKKSDGYILKLGPIHDPQALAKAVLVVSTTSGELSLPFRIKNL